MDKNAKNNPMTQETAIPTQPNPEQPKPEVNKPEPKADGKSAFARIIGIIALILLVLAAIWAITKYVPALSGAKNRLQAAVALISKIFVAEPKVAVSTDHAEIQSGEKTTISWVPGNITPKDLFISYPCLDQVSVQIETYEGTTRNLTCGRDYALLSLIGSDNSAVISIFSNMQSTEVPINIGFSLASTSPVKTAGSVNIRVVNPSVATINPEPNSGISAEALALIWAAQSLNSGSSQTQTESETRAASSTRENPVPERIPAKTTPKAGPETTKVYPIGTSTVPVQAAAPDYGLPDLGVKILDTGILDKTSGAYTATSSLHAGDRIAVRFEVENFGTKESGSWYFNAALPTFPFNIFQSDGQQSLGPGDKIIYTLGFDSIVPNQDDKIVINIDPAHSIQEATKVNNLASVIVHPTQ